MTDNITLPREVVQEAADALERSVATCFSEYDHREVLSDPKHFVNRAITALRTALAAEQQKPSGYAYRYSDGALRFNNGRPVNGGSPVEAVPYWFAPPSTHPGYIIGSHWLETAYSRICAGEAEADVLRDIGLVREEAFLTGVAHLKAENEALRRDAERWRHWRDSHGFATIDHEKGRCFVTLICDCDDPDQVRAKRFRGEDSFEWLDAFTDAAMKEGT